MSILAIPANTNECYKNLAIAIVEQGISDFEDDLRKNHGLDRLVIKKKWKKWFMSDWVSLLIDADGLSLYEKVLDNFEKTGRCFTKITPMKKADEDVKVLERKEMRLRKRKEA